MDEKSVYPISYADVLNELSEQLERLRVAKGQAVTSEQARAVAVTITELEKVCAYFHVYVVTGTVRQPSGVN